MLGKVYIVTLLLSIRITLGNTSWLWAGWHAYRGWWQHLLSCGKMKWDNVPTRFCSFKDQKDASLLPLHIFTHIWELKKSIGFFSLTLSCRIGNVSLQEYAFPWLFLIIHEPVFQFSPLYLCFLFYEFLLFLFFFMLSLGWLCYSFSFLFF